MTGTVLYDSARSTAEAQPGPPPRALGFRSGAPSDVTHVAYAAQVSHLHELVAIANGPDYCLCGQTWPCAHRVSAGADSLSG